MLSYRAECTDPAAKLPHVFYIYNSSTSWTTGRTELYNAATRLGTRYHYYTVMDDDIRPIWLNATRTSENPWRYYEQFLLRIEPPLAALDNEAWTLVNKVKAARAHNGCTLNGTNPEYFLAKWFDGEFNAFHYKAIKYILEPVLPYWNRFDTSSWWISQWYVNIMTDMAFPNKAVLLSQIFGTNHQHRNYPKGMHSQKTLEMIAGDVTSIVPPQLRDAVANRLKGWVSQYANILTTIQDTYCQPIPTPHDKLVPFQGI